MKVILGLLGCLIALASPGEQPKLPSAPSEVIHVATALDHLTVLEFGEPVTMAAAGSSEFQVERHEDKVFLKPLKPGASTDLFVWTASRRFTYELEAPGEVKDMNFALDHRIPDPNSKPRPSMDDIADTVLNQALLGAQRIDSSSVKDSRNRVTVRVEQVLRSRNTTYIHYSVKNTSGRRYRVPQPLACEADELQPRVSPFAFHRVQLSEPVTDKLGILHQRSLPIVKALVQKQELAPGEETQGIITVREQLASPAIVQLIFGEFRDSVQVTVVL